MTFSAIEDIIEYLLFASCIFLLIGSIYISFKTKFVQVRLLPNIIKALFRSFSLDKQDNKNTIMPHKALFTAMSTTLGIGTIAGPAIAIHLGGPGALLGFLLASILGSAATFTEVNLCVKFRTRSKLDLIIGGPMEYLKNLLSPNMAKWYALSCCILMTAWSGAQANQLTAILNSPLLGDYRIAPIFSGSAIALLVFISLFGGIKWISEISAKIVPSMFILFLGSCLWILVSNLELIPSILSMIFTSAFTPQAMASGTLVGGWVSALRWGIFKEFRPRKRASGLKQSPIR